MKKGFLSQLKQGMQVELEHRDVTKGDPVMTARIALGHLAERKDYYTKLKKAGLNPKRNPTKGNFAWVLLGLGIIAVLAIPMFRNAEGSLTLIEYLRRGR